MVTVAIYALQLTESEIFPEGALGSAPKSLGGGGLSTYRELASVANEIGQPDLVYRCQNPFKFPSRSSYELTHFSKVHEPREPPRHLEFQERRRVRCRVVGLEGGGLEGDDRFPSESRPAPLPLFLRPEPAHCTRYGRGPLPSQNFQETVLDDSKQEAESSIRTI